MKEQIILSKLAFERLLQTIVYLEEEKHDLLEYFDTVSDRSRFAQFIEKYIAQVDALIRNIQVSANAPNTLPFVLINSEVTLSPLDGSPLTKVRIVLPLHNTEDTDVSCLSPMGMALLLKGVDEEVTHSAPLGRVRCRITSIVLSVE